MGSMVPVGWAWRGQQKEPQLESRAGQNLGLVTATLCNPGCHPALPCAADTYKGQAQTLLI